MANISGSSVLPFDGNELKIALERRGISQRELAADLGVSENSISRWITNRRQPRRDHIERLRWLLEFRSCEFRTVIAWQLAEISPWWSPSELTASLATMLHQVAEDHDALAGFELRATERDTMVLLAALNGSQWTTFMDVVQAQLDERALSAKSAVSIGPVRRVRLSASGTGYALIGEAVSDALSILAHAAHGERLVDRRAVHYAEDAEPHTRDEPDSTHEVVVVDFGSPTTRGHEYLHRARRSEGDASHTWEPSYPDRHCDVFIVTKTTARIDLDTRVASVTMHFDLRGNVSDDEHEGTWLRDALVLPLPHLEGDVEFRGPKPLRHELVRRADQRASTSLRVDVPPVLLTAKTTLEFELRFRARDYLHHATVKGSAGLVHRAHHRFLDYPSFRAKRVSHEVTYVYEFVERQLGDRKVHCTLPGSKPPQRDSTNVLRLTTNTSPTEQIPHVTFEVICR